MQLKIKSREAKRVLATLRLPNETLSECADRLLANLASISMDLDNYEQHFGPQKPAKVPSRLLNKKNSGYH